MVEFNILYIISDLLFNGFRILAFLDTQERT